MSRVAVLTDLAARVRTYAHQTKRLRWLPVALLVAVAVAAFLVGRLTVPGLPDTQGPPSLTLPPHASLVGWEEYPNDHVAIWYYSVPDAAQTTVMRFFTGQLTRGSWSGFTSNFATGITRYGQAFTGSNGYLKAKSGSLEVEINTGDQSFGAFLLQHPLDEHAIALKIDVTTTDAAGCGSND
jgi:hypothetical protein